MNPLAPNPGTTEPRDDREAIVDIQLADIKAFTESPNCSASDLQHISIHLAVMIAKISLNPGSEVLAAQPASTSFGMSTNNKAVSTPRRGVIRYIRRPHSTHKKKGDGVQKGVLSIANGGPVPVIAAFRGARKKRSEANKVGKDETWGSGILVISHSELERIGTAKERVRVGLLGEWTFVEIVGRLGIVSSCFRTAFFSPDVQL